MKRSRKVDDIFWYMYWIEATLKGENRRGRTDTNLWCEGFFKDILNIVYGHNFKNLNTEVSNKAYIDLSDCKQGISVQVTSRTDKKKFTETINSFYKNKSPEEKLWFMVIASKIPKWEFEENVTVICLNKLRSDVEELRVSKLLQIEARIKQEVSPESLFDKQDSIPQKIDTFVLACTSEVNDLQKNFIRDELNKLRDWLSLLPDEQRKFISSVVMQGDYCLGHVAWYYDESTHTEDEVLIAKQLCKLNAMTYNVYINIPGESNEYQLHFFSDFISDELSMSDLNYFNAIERFAKGEKRREIIETLLIELDFSILW